MARYPSHLLRGIAVLAVFDDEDEREMLVLLLSSLGARVNAVASAAEALDACAASPPHVILSDISLSCCDGYEFIRKLRTRAQGDGATVPAVAVTGLCRPADRLRAFEAGYQEHLAKPVDFERLVAVIGSLVGAPTGDAAKTLPPSRR
jgi:CheY-like chemotaxis protein